MNLDHIVLIKPVVNLGLEFRHARSDFAGEKSNLTQRARAGTDLSRVKFPPLPKARPGCQGCSVHRKAVQNGDLWIIVTERRRGQLGM
jgi:hypothetical protein